MWGLTAKDLTNNQQLTNDAMNRSSTTSFATGFFVLSEQPSARQRKSYPSEHRPLSPNPLTIVRRDQPGESVPNITSGTVTVKLVNREGEELPVSKRNILYEESEDGSSVNNNNNTMTKPLDLNSHSANFTLLAMETSEGNMFRLHFHIVFYITGPEGPVKHEEVILSRPFIVYSLRRKNLKEAPSVFEMRPTEGFVTGGSETECWIKGKGFSESVDVLFGQLPARVIDCADNLVTVIPPKRTDIKEPTTVVVEVANRYLNEQLMATKKLNFTYLPGS